MAITINTNVTSLVAQRNLNSVQDSLNNSMRRLSSGLRINRAKDDAAGLAISRLMEKKIRGLEQGVRNANDGISLIQTAEGSLIEVGNNLQRMRELSLQASNGTYTAADRSALQTEFSALRAEIDRVANTAEFNGFKLMNGSSSSLDIQVGPDNSANDRIKISLKDVNSSALGISGNSITAASAAQAAVTKLDTAISSVSKARAQLGADEARLTTAVAGNMNMAENLAGAKSRILDVDFAKETATLAKNSILVQAGASMLSQANQIPSLALQLLG